uniref:Uncharacterized protein n=1 Tax=Cucumis melo TaxID=3656 RepID=A0A9I9CD11_CUCME
EGWLVSGLAWEVWLGLDNRDFSSGWLRLKTAVAAAGWSSMNDATRWLSSDEKQWMVATRLTRGGGCRRSCGRRSLRPSKLRSSKRAAVEASSRGSVRPSKKLDEEEEKDRRRS